MDALQKQIITSHNLEVIADTRAIAIAVFRKNLAKIIHDAGIVLENSPLTLAEVQTLLDGVTVGGKKISDCKTITNLQQAAELVAHASMQTPFAFSRQLAKKINEKIACEESLEWGVFRGEGEQITDISIAGTSNWKPLKTERRAANLIAVFEEDLYLLKHYNAPFECALKYFLSASYRQYFYDGNKRSALWSANAMLMSSGIRPLGILQSQRERFNELMIDFYETAKMDALLQFLTQQWHQLHSTKEQS